MKKLIEIKKCSFLKFEIFFRENHHPTRYIKYKMVDSFLLTNELWHIIFLETIWNDFELNLRSCFYSAKYIAR